MRLLSNAANPLSMRFILTSSPFSSWLDGAFRVLIGKTGARSGAAVLLFLASALPAWAGYWLIPMDADRQANHLKAYGLTYSALERGTKGEWLLNYRGGSFLFPDDAWIRRECTVRGISGEPLSDADASALRAELAAPASNTEIVLLEKAPKIAVYSPDGKQPWDDAVTLVLTYAEIPYDRIYDREILRGDLAQYEWLHLHHEDFTGQYGKFYGAYRHATWYMEDKKRAEEEAAALGFSKVSELKRAVTDRIQGYVANGGFLFAMCSATDSYDVARAAHQTDVCAAMFDGDPADLDAANKLDFLNTLAFQNFSLVTVPEQYEISSIDVTDTRRIPEELDFFALFDFSAKWDPVPTMLCQNHEKTIAGFMGQTTAFRMSTIKPNVRILGAYPAASEARYIHGGYGKGLWTFYGGHDPEDYRHQVGDPPTELAAYPNSPGYRLILNNILFPAAEKKKQKT